MRKMGMLTKIAGAALAFAAGVAVGKAAGSNERNGFGPYEGCRPEDCAGCGGCDSFCDECCEDDLFEDVMDSCGEDSDSDEDEAENPEDDSDGGD